MTSSIKNSPELDSPGKPGVPSRNSESNAGPSPRSNPVCLEVGVTLRSLPSEAGGLTQPIREEIKTVIVFDNGAVLRSTNTLPEGLTLILSNSSGRDVVCKVMGGRNLPSVKGYVEVEFLEPVKDFWNIHQEGTAVAVAPPPPAPPMAQEVPPAPKPTPPKPAPAIEPPARPVSVVSSGTPSFDEFPGPMNVPSFGGRQESKPEPPVAASGMGARTISGYDHSNVNNSTSVANWTPSEPEAPAEKPAPRTPREPSLGSSSPFVSTPAVPTRDFMSKGLMAYNQEDAASGASGSRTPQILGAAAVALAVIAGVVFFTHRTAAPVSVASAPAVNQPAKPEPVAATNSPAPAPIQPVKEEASSAEEQSKPTAQAQPVSVEPIRSAAAVAPIPAATLGTSVPVSRPDSKTARQQAKNDAAAKPAAAPASTRPAISNLKMSTPSVPSKNISNVGEVVAPMTEMAPPEAPVGAAPAGLLTSSGRTSSPPTPPPSPAAPPPAPKTVTDPKLISSTRLVYPVAARQANIQGSVTVSANIDEHGKVVSAKALNGPLLLRAAAEESVKQWKYSPGLIDGKPEPSHVTVSVDFRLN